MSRLQKMMYLLVQQVRFPCPAQTYNHIIQSFVKRIIPFKKANPFYKLLIFCNYSLIQLFVCHSLTIFYSLAKIRILSNIVDKIILLLSNIFDKIGVFIFATHQKEVSSIMNDTPTMLN